MNPSLRAVLTLSIAGVLSALAGWLMADTYAHRTARAAKVELSAMRVQLEACRADIVERDDDEGRLEASYRKQDGLRGEITLAKSLTAEAREQIAALELGAVSLRAEAEEGAACVAAGTESTPEGRLNRMKAACSTFEAYGRRQNVDSVLFLNEAYQIHDSGLDRYKVMDDPTYPFGWQNVPGGKECWSAIVTFVYGY